MESCISVALIVIAEVYLLSFIPIERPLRFLWLFHTAVVFAFVSSTLYLWKIDAWKDLMRHSKRVIFDFFGNGDLLQRLLIGLAVIIFPVYFLAGVFFVPSAPDTLSYHIPLAIQPYQDGRIANIDSDLPWTYLYPRGAEVMWYWTLQLTKSDLLFNAVQLFFGFNLLLAIYVLSKKLGNGIRESLMAAIIFLTMPIFYILTISGYIDMDYGASILAGIAFLAPSPKKFLKYDIFFAALALSLAALIKVPIIATLFIGIMLFAKMFSKEGGRYIFSDSTLFFKSKFFFLSLAALVLSSSHYIENWITYDNPIYPIGLSVLGTSVFKGIMNPTDFGLGVNTLMGDVKSMSSIQRFYSSWADVFNGLNVDSFGSTGAVFILAIVFPFIIFLMKTLAERNAYHIALSAIVSLSFIIPGLFTPRYNLVMTAIGIVGAINIFMYFEKRILNTLMYALLGLCVLTISIPFDNMTKSIAWIKSLSGTDGFDFRNRSSIVAEKVSLGGYDNYPTAQVIKYIRDNSLSGDMLGWNVNGFHALLWNRTYSNRVVFLPGTEMDRWPKGPSLMTVPTEKQIKKWKNIVEKMKPRHIVVYANSIYPSLISSLDTKYIVAFKETEGNFPMEVLERVD
ncbi:MAG: hypothetical protein PHT88_01440 [Candidatus Moranbacteria bacterium]|nr:hypothetical protein [Candidatus Moranbacteria bacterium]